MHAVKLTNSHKEDFYNFLKEQLDYASSNNKQWNFPLDIFSINYISDKRHIYAIYNDNKIVGVGAYNTLTFMPYSLLDTFSISYKLSYKDLSLTGQLLANNVLSSCVKDQIYTVYHVGELRMWDLLGFRNKGTFWKNESNWVANKVSIIPANTKSKYRMFNIFMEDETFPYDLLVYKLDYNTSLLENEDIIENG